MDLMYLTFIECKNESGHDSDALMQLARDYEMYTLSPPEEHVADGRPVFLIAVVGMCRPLLFPFLPENITEVAISASLGDSRMARDLSSSHWREPCIMALDSTGERESELAQLLYSIRNHCASTTRRLCESMGCTSTHGMSTRWTDYPATTLQQCPESIPRI